jgi:hypothetical protein
MISVTCTRLLAISSVFTCRTKSHPCTTASCPEAKDLYRDFRFLARHWQQMTPRAALEMRLKYWPHVARGMPGAPRSGTSHPC